MGRYRKKPVEIDAVLYDGSKESIADCARLGNFGLFSDHLSIKTLGGTMRCEVGDWLIRGVKGELYPCKPDIFEATYEVA